MPLSEGNPDRCRQSGGMEIASRLHDFTQVVAGSTNTRRFSQVFPFRVGTVDLILKSKSN
jgi:hypothetical protein